MKKGKLKKEEWICIWARKDCRGWNFSWVEDEMGTTQLSGTCFLIHSKDAKGEYLRKEVRMHKRNPFTCCRWRKKSNA